MEYKYKLDNNGQALQQQDFNGLGEVAALVDDHVLAELLRMKPYDGSTVTRGVMPYRAVGTRDSIVAPNGASGSVLVNPFRAFIGSRTAVATDAKKNWRDIRSTVSVGTTTLATTVNISANASGNPRWDLIYAIVSVDVNSATVTRKVKNPTTKVIAGTSVSVTAETTIGLYVQAGTAAASPTWPSVPSDSGSSYRIPLAYVRVPNGFGATSTVAKSDIATVVPVVSVAESSGAASIEVADQHYTPGSTLTTARIQSWGSGGFPSTGFMPSSLNGGRSLLVYLDLFSATTSDWSHADTGVIDSRDWRGRIVRWMACIGSTAGGGVDPAWAFGGVGSADFPGVLSLQTHTASTNRVVHGFGQTIKSTASSDGLCRIDPGNADIAASSFVAIYCDHSDSGKLKLKTDTTNKPGRKLFIWLDFTAPFDGV